MLKIVKEEQTILVENRKTFCDLCNNVIENSSFMQIEVPFVNSGYRKRFEDTHIDVCTTTCLSNNFKGFDFLLNSKIIPTVNALSKNLNDREMGKECEKRLI